MQLSLTQLDRWIGRLLRVDATTKPYEQSVNSAGRAERAFGFSLVFSGVRCVLQYVIFPFILPLIGIASEAATPILLAVNIIAILSIIYSVRRFWQIDYRYKWQYLGVALAALSILAVFIGMDLHTLYIG